MSTPKLDFSSTTSTTPLAISDATSKAATTRTPTSSTIPLTDRLGLVHPRWAYGGGEGQDGRGQHAYIKLLTNATLKTAYRKGDLTKREILDGNPKELFRMAAGMVEGSGYDRFLLTGISGSISEKVQIREVFGDGEVAYFFGRQPIVVTLTGLLIDSPDNQWLTDWIRMYSEFMRGTQLAKNYELLKIVLPNMSLTGAAVGMSWSQDASRDTDIQFSLQFLVKSMAPTPVTGDAFLRSPDRTNQINFGKTAGFLTKAGMQVTKADSAKDTIKDPDKTPLQRAKALLDPYTSLAQNAQDYLDSGGGLLDMTGLGSLTTISAAAGSGSSGSIHLFSIYGYLSGFRSSFFSPIYGVIGSLSKLMSSINGLTQGSFGGFSTDIRNILRDLKALVPRARAIQTLLQNSPPSNKRYPVPNFTTTDGASKALFAQIGLSQGVMPLKPISAVQITAYSQAGSSAPQSLSLGGGKQSTSGQIPGFLQEGAKGTFSTAVLPSGVKPVTGTTSKASLLTAIASATSSSGDLSSPLGTYAGTLVFEAVLDNVPSSDVTLETLANSVFSPSVLIVEEDCGTQLGRVLRTDYNLEGRIELATGQPLTQSRIETLISSENYQTSVRRLDACVSRGGVCKKCFEATYRDHSAVNVGTHYRAPPEYILASETFIPPASGPISYVSTLTGQDKSLFFLNGELTSNPELQPRGSRPIGKITVQRVFTIRSPYMYWLARTYSGAMLGIGSLASFPTHLPPRLMEELVTEGLLEEIFHHVAGMTSVPQPMIEYSAKVPGRLEKAVFLIALGVIYSDYS